MKKICVFCGARDGFNPSIRQVVSKVGKILAKLDITIVFGGSNRGLMGIVTDASLSHGGKVVGVLPDVLEGIETEHTKITKLIKTPCLASRKQKMMDLADAFLVLPGGFGTLDELYEVLVLRKIKENKKPIFIFNYQGFWNDSLKQIRHLIKEGFVSSEEGDIFHVIEDEQALIQQIYEEESEVAI